MKPLLTLCFVVFCLMAEGSNPYRSYLVSTVALQNHEPHPPFGHLLLKEKEIQTAEQRALIQTSCVITRYEIPKGNVFCRMEDKLTRSTGLWLKIGVK